MSPRPPWPGGTRAAGDGYVDEREAIADAARALLARDPEVSLDAIASEAGVSRRTLRAHYASRAALLDDLAERGTRRVQRAVDAVLELAEPDPVLRIAALVAAAWDEVEHVRVVASLTAETSRRGVVDGLAPVVQRVTAAIEEGVRLGRVRDDVPAESLARLLVAGVLDVLAESVRTGLDRVAGRRVVIHLALSTLGLGWREAAELVAARPELSAPRPRVDPLWPPTTAIPTFGS